MIQIQRSFLLLQMQKNLIQLLWNDRHSQACYSLWCGNFVGSRPNPILRRPIVKLRTQKRNARKIEESQCQGFHPAPRCRQIQGVHVEKVVRKTARGASRTLARHHMPCQTEVSGVVLTLS